MAPSSAVSCFNNDLYTTATSSNPCQTSLTADGITADGIVITNRVGGTRLALIKFEAFSSTNAYCDNKVFYNGKLFYNKKAAIQYKNKLNSQKTAQKMFPKFMNSKHIPACKIFHTNYNSKQKLQQKRKAQKLKLGLKL